MPHLQSTRPSPEVLEKKPRRVVDLSGRLDDVAGRGSLWKIVACVEGGDQRLTVATPVARKALMEGAEHERICDC